MAINNKFKIKSTATILLLVMFTYECFSTDFGIISEDRIAQGTEAGFTSVVDVSPALGARDAVKLSDNTVVAYNGTFDPLISFYVDNTWFHIDVPGLSTINNISYGGIASNDRFVWVTDMRTFGSPEDELQGIIQVDLEGSFSDQRYYRRFAENISPIDLTLGKDGLLYALYPGGSPEGRFIDVYNPNDGHYIKTINLADIFGHTGHRSIAVDGDSNIYIADWDGDIQLIDKQQNLIGSINVASSLFDIDIVDDKIISGDRFGRIFIADLNLNFYNEIHIEDLDPRFNDSGVFILGDSVDNSGIVIDHIFHNSFE